jgi:thiamine biosynthesis lipoprotein
LKKKKKHMRHIWLSVVLIGMICLSAACDLGGRHSAVDGAETGAETGVETETETGAGNGTGGVSLSGAGDAYGAGNAVGGGGGDSRAAAGGGSETVAGSGNETGAAAGGESGSRGDGSGVGAAAPLSQYSKEFFALDTIISVSLYAASEEAANEALDGVESLFNGVHERMTRFAEGNLANPGLSQVHRVNAGAGGQPVPIDDETFALISKAIGYCDASGGAFDIGIGAVSDLWDFNGASRIPSDAELSEALGKSGYARIELYEAEKAVSAPSGLTLDLGGVAKGYATQKSAELLKSRGIGHALINAGGNVFALGGKPASPAEDGAPATVPWKIGIKHPRTEGALLAAIQVEDQAVVTSGDYEKYFEAEGARYHHILDPKTGKPAGECMSVTIVAADSTLADFLSTAAFVLGPEDGMALVESFSDAYAVFVGVDSSVTVSAGLEGRIAFY